MEKFIKGIILSALFLALAGTGTVRAEEIMFSMENAPADELSLDGEPKMAGRVESTGIYFEVKDSEWLNISLTSSELIKLTLESVPNMITMQVEAAASAATTQITIKGLAPQTTYHKYEDNYHNHEEFTTDDNGTYTYSQDLSVPHIVFIQTQKSTKFIKDDATGGDCYSIGIWDSPTKTCTMTMDLNETIQIDSDGVTLNGNGHTLTGNKTGNGVYIYRKSGVTIKNLNIKTFASGIYLRESNNNSITNNYASNNSFGIYLWLSSSNALIENVTNSNGTGIAVRSGTNNNLTANRANNNTNYGMSISSGNTLSRNIMNDNKYNISLSVGSELDNVDTSNLVDGKPIYYIRNASDQTYDATTNAGVFYCINCYNITIDGLTLTKNGTGIILWKTQNSTVKNVILSSNRMGVYLYTSTGNTIYDNTISNNGSGILLSSSNNNALMDNTILSNSTGIHVDSSSGNTLSRNNVSINGYGIFLRSSSNNTLTGNNASNGSYGISIESSNNNILTGNNASMNTYGISLSYSSYNTLSSNVMNGNIYNFNLSLQYDEPEVSLDNNIDTSNIVDGKPIYYIRNASNQTYDATTNAGVFYCINCNNITIDGLTFSNNQVGVLLWKTQNSMIRNVTALHVGNGIDASYSSGNVFEGNNLSSDAVGIQLISANNSTISNNNISNNAYGISFSGNGNSITNNMMDANFYGGIFLYGSDNIITENTFSNSRGNWPFGGGGFGVYVSTANNTIYHNNFINNARQALGQGNIFNLPAPIGGNYWSDWTTPDNNGDGFVDNPYVLYNAHGDNLGQDNLPWTKQDGWKNNSSDSTPPTTMASLSGTSGNNGWYLSGVQVTLTAVDNDGGTGVAKTEYSFDGTNWVTYSAPFTVNAEGTTTVYYKSADSAGNTEAAKSLTVSIDKTPPTITGTATTSPNANGWHNTDVTVTFTCTDGTSGIAQCPSPITVSSEGAGQIVSGTAVDNAGNSATASVTLNIDKTPPSITGAATTLPNANGWYNTDVTVHFTASDNMSGVNTVTPDIIISMEGANQSVSGTAFDMAGNSAIATVSGINVDKTAPVITITSPAANQYDHSATINISFTATDDVSGIYKTTVYLDGQQYDPANPISLLYLPLGTHTLRVESENYAGLIASQSVDFEIIATASGTTSLITTLYQTGAIDSAGIVTSLTQQLQAAQAAISSGQTVSAQNILEAFINLLDAQSGKHISSSAAEILMADALYMLGQL